MLSPLEYYKQQKELYNGQLAAVARREGRVAMGRLWVALAAVALIIYIINAGTSQLWWGVGALAITFLALVRRHLALIEEQDGIRLHIQVIDNEFLALEGNYSRFADGAAFTNTLHPYSYDLDLFGKHSIYQMLCRAVTLGGEKLLAERLMNRSLAADKIARQQEVVKELSTMPDLLQQFRVAGMGVKEAPKDQGRLTDWLQGPNEFLTDRLVSAAAIVMPVLSLAFIGYSFFTGGVFGGLYVVAIANMVLLRRYAKKVKQVAEGVGNTAKLIGKYEALLLQVRGAGFQHSYLKDIAEKGEKSLSEIVKLKKLVNLFDSRDNNMVGPLMNLFFLFDITSILRLEKWKQANSTLLPDVVALMIEMDVLVSCAVYAFNHPGYVYATINATDNGVSAVDLRHPLLPPTVAVGNNFTLGTDEQFYLLTGANMTGKSTFIRTVGVSVVLFNLGLPLPAKEVTLPVVNLYTSMRVTDSVQDDISYFKAELNRIQSLMNAVKAGAEHYLVLLDEPLRGTNSADKQQGTRAIVNNLLGFKAIGIVATHDTILCDMEQNYPGRVTNYHFESKVETVGLSFDFKLKRGASTSNNATLLMRQMGIITG